MRRLALILAVLCVAVPGTALVAGCGSDDSGSSGSGLDEALGYLPDNAAFAIVINTDPDGEQYKNVSAIVKKFPFSDQITGQLEDQLSNQKLNFNEDIKPVLGNPFVVGVADPKDLQGDSNESSFVGALMVKDKDKLDALIKKSQLKESGEVEGAKVYEDPNDPTSVLGVNDDVAVFANDRAHLETALKQHDADNKLDEDTFNEAVGDLPDDALVRLYADLEQIIKADPGSADALKVKWVAALRKLGMTVAAEKDALKVDFDLNTESDGLTDADLPIASGEEAPSIVKRAGEISVGLRGASQIVKFGQQAAQAVDPQGFGQFVTAKKQINEKLGIDIDKDLVDQFSGEAALTLDTKGGFGLRAQPKDPKALEDTLAKLADRLPAAAKDLGAPTIGIAKPRGGDDFYAVATENQRFVMGVVDDVFVLANDAGRAAALATAQPEKVDGAKGALVVNANAEELVGQAIQGQLQGLQGLGAGLLLDPLGDLTQSVQADTSGLRGTISLGID